MKYLFCFGYENPQEFDSNQRFGTDFESSQAVWISAGDEQEALSCGIKYAKIFVAALYRTQGLKNFQDWDNRQYAYWIEENPQSKWTQTELDALESIIASDFSHAA